MKTKKDKIETLKIETFNIRDFMKFLMCDDFEEFHKQLQDGSLIEKLQDVIDGKECKENDDTITVMKKIKKFIMLMLEMHALEKEIVNTKNYIDMYFRCRGE